MTLFNQQPISLFAIQSITSLSSVCAHSLHLLSSTPLSPLQPGLRPHADAVQINVTREHHMANFSTPSICQLPLTQLTTHIF